MKRAKQVLLRSKFAVKLLSKPPQTLLGQACIVYAFQGQLPQPSRLHHATIPCMEDAAMMWVGGAIATCRAALKPRLNERQTGLSVKTLICRGSLQQIEAAYPTDRIGIELHMHADFLESSSRAPCPSTRFRPLLSTSRIHGPGHLLLLQVMHGILELLRQHRWCFSQAMRPIQTCTVSEAMSMSAACAVMALR